MKIKLKPISEQVMVLTGATSGMGLTTARMAAERGARLVLVGRSEEVLVSLVKELHEAGRSAIYVVADVTKEDEVQGIANRAVEHYGGFDTWVNLAGLTTYGSLEQIPTEDHRQLFEVNYWSVFYGSRVAARHLRNRGGALINTGSILSSLTVPYQGTYCASKHAIQAFTDALRMELEAEKAPISVTLIKPSSIDTPLRFHGKNFFTHEPQNPPPAYAPQLAAEAIVRCAQVPTRELTVGGAGKLMTLLGSHFPRLSEKFMEYSAASLQQTGNPAGPRADNSLYAASEDGEKRGGTKFVFEDSVYTKARLHPGRTLLLAAGVGAVLASGLAVARASSNGRSAWRARGKETLKKIGEQASGPDLLPRTRSRPLRRRVSRGSWSRWLP